MQSPRVYREVRSQVVLLAKPSDDPITRRAGKSLAREARGTGDLFIGGEVCGICLSSE